ncbi:MAG: gliding motility-associated C-terminal domain-containing protein [Ferruginibacter sp.]
MKIKLSQPPVSNLPVKRSSLMQTGKWLFKALLLIITLAAFTVHKSHAQFTATWALTSDKSVVVTGADAADMQVGDMFTANGSHNNDGFQCKIQTSPWPSTPTDGYHVDFPLSPSAGTDLTITSLTIRKRTSGSSGDNLLQLAYQVNGTGTWTLFGPVVPATSGGSGDINFGSLNQTFFAGNTYVVRLYAYSSTTNMSNSRNLFLRNVVFSGTTAISGTPPAVTTNSVGTITNSTAVANGTLTAGTIPILASGVCWSTDPTPTVDGGSVTTNGPAASGTIADGTGGNITGLAANTVYYVRAYATTLAGTVYGDPAVMFTSGPAVAPTISTTDATNITSFGAVTGGTITDDGGDAVTARGVVWSTTQNPTVPSTNSTSDGTGAGSFSSLITGLTASTTYYVRAYATNGIGTSYGNEITVVTTAPQPSLFASVANLNFPATTVGTSSSLTYTLTGSTLDGSPITITAPAGFTVEPSTITYSGNSFTQVITVTFTPPVLGSASGAITQSGGGATGVYIVSPLVSGSGKQPTPAITSNQGNDFWLGFGYQKDMNASSQRVYMNIYISAEQATEVIVEMPGLPGFQTQTIPVPANTVVTVPNYIFDKSTFLDSTGISGKGVHVYSTDGKLISAWLHTYSNDNSAGGSLLFPTNTWNTSYFVQSSGGKVNNGYVGNSYFFVIAQDDNTVVKFKPSVPIIKPSAAFKQNHTADDILYPADIEASVTLNRGQVFNAVGYIDGNTRFGDPGLGALDLTGTKVYTDDCSKKIAVFGGDGRLGMTDVPGCTAQSPTSDHLIQQMLPSSAWGKRYLTVPTKTMEFNMFRITVQDPATVVKLNNVVLDPSTLIKGLYYSIANDSLNLIEADKPVSVTQYILDRACSYLSVNNGIVADPEMIIISPVEQGIKRVTVYSAPFMSTAGESSTGGSFINVVLKKEGLSSFQIDGLTGTALVDTGVASSSAYPDVTDASSMSSVDSAFHPHPYDSNYVWAKFRVQTNAQHIISSDAEFTAIAYGTRGGSAGESYGYNAGTLVKDLTSNLVVENPYGGGVSSGDKELKTCRGTDFKVSAVLPYKTNKITFGFGANPHVSPNADTTILGANGADIAEDSSFVNDGVTYYVYRLSTKYVFDAAGDYSIQVTSFNPTASDGCLGGGDKTISYGITVVEGLNAAFDITYDKCISDSVILKNVSDGLGHEIVSTKWSYDGGIALPEPEGSQDSTNKFKNPDGNKNFTLLTVNDIGCFNELTKPLPGNDIPDVTFTAPTPNPVCSNAQAITLVGSPADEKGVFSGPGVTGNQFNPTTAGAGTHTLKYTYTIGVACVTVKEQSIVVSPSQDLGVPEVGPVCITDNAITLQGTPAGGTFSGPGVTSNQGVYQFNPATAGANTHSITYTNGTCSQPKTFTIKVNDKPVVNVGPDITTNLRVGKPFQVVPVEGATYSWSPAQWLSSATVVNPVVTPQQLGEFTYQVSVSLGGGCVTTGEVKVTVEGECVKPPKAFTPNHDGFNDKWIVSNGACAEQVKVDVYNRWGGRVFSSTNYKNDWEGTAGGKVVPDGTYYFVIEARLVGGAVQYFKGNVTIMR